MASPWITWRLVKSYANSGMGTAALAAAELVRLLPPGAFAATSAIRALFADGIWTQEKLKPGGMDGTVVADVAAAATGALTAAHVGIPVRLSLVVASGATGNVTFTSVPFKIRVHNVWVIKTTANGGAGDLVNVKNGTTITGDIDINVSDKAVVRCSAIDDAFWDIAAAGTITVTRTLATNTACIVIIDGTRVS